MASQLSTKQKIKQLYAKLKEQQSGKGSSTVKTCKEMGLMGPKEAADLMGCHSGKLRELTEKGVNDIMIPATDTGLKTQNGETVWGYKEEDILEALEKILGGKKEA